MDENGQYNQKRDKVTHQNKDLAQAVRTSLYYFLVTANFCSSRTHTLLTHTLAIPNNLTTPATSKSLIQGENIQKTAKMQTRKTTAAATVITLKMPFPLQDPLPHLWQVTPWLSLCYMTQLAL